MLALLVGALLVVAADAAATEDGAGLYRRHCASCHGPDARGDGPDAEFYEPRPRDLRSGFLERYDTDALVARIRTGAPLALGLDLPALRARAESVEAIAAHLERLPSIDWRRVEAGTEVYIDRCELCHGPFGRPPDRLPAGVDRPRDLSDPAWQRATTDEALTEGIRHGRKDMPGLVPRVDPAESEAVVGFIRLLSPGFEEYSRHCAACHGDDGRGDGGFSEAFRRPTVSFDRGYFERRDPEEVRSAIWHMVADEKPAMPHLRHSLTEAEARLIVEHLKRSAAPQKDP